MKRQSIGLALTAISLAGCAVLQIDVDVYKGPLANHEQVQAQQISAMTTAARPLLMAMRDQLAVEHWLGDRRAETALPWSPLEEAKQRRGIVEK